MDARYGELYIESRSRVAELVGSLDEADVSRTIAATPKWSGHDVLAHLAGAAEDFVSGNMAGAPSEAWTGAHVARAEGLPTDELVERWRTPGDAMAEALDSGQAPLHPLWDVLTHEGDLRETHGRGRLPVDAVDAALAPLAAAFVAGYDGPRRLNINTGAEAWQFGDGEPSLTLTVSPYELFRGILSRRSANQMASWDWVGDQPVDAFEYITVFGVRDDDQPIPED